MEEIPRVFLLDPEVLLATRSAIYDGDEALQAADERLLQEADQALYAAPVSVVDKEALPPSGDPRDYMSQAPYWWPEAEGEQCGTYVWRDGEVNPEAEVYDRGRLGSMCSALSSLAPAYFFSDLEHFAEHASLLLRTWFLDETTAMNPHLEYGQAIPSRCTGQGTGIIDTHGFSWLVEMLGLLGASSAWNEDDQSGLQAWFGAYLDWLLTSDHGREEAAQNNHHGTWYDVQVASLALFAGRDEVANEICTHSFPRRLAAQIEADGRQPLELVRTRSLDYCLMNLTALFDLADLGGRVDIDFETDAIGTDGSGKEVFLRDLWPPQEEIRDEIGRSVQAKMFEEEYGNVFNGNPIWNGIPVAGSNRRFTATCTLACVKSTAVRPTASTRPSRSGA